MAETNAISSILSSLPLNQPQQAVAPQPEAKGVAPQPKVDVVTISAQGKQAVQEAAPESRAGERQESYVKKSTEAQTGRM